MARNIVVVVLGKDESGHQSVRLIGERNQVDYVEAAKIRLMPEQSAFFWNEDLKIPDLVPETGKTVPQFEPGTVLRAKEAKGYFYRADDENGVTRPREAIILSHDVETVGMVDLAEEVSVLKSRVLDLLENSQNPNPTSSTDYFAFKRECGVQFHRFEDNEALAFVHKRPDGSFLRWMLARKGPLFIRSGQDWFGDMFNREKLVEPGLWMVTNGSFKEDQNGRHYVDGDISRITLEEADARFYRRASIYEKEISWFLKDVPSEEREASIKKHLV